MVQSVVQTTATAVMCPSINVKKELRFQLKML